MAKKKKDSLKKKRTTPTPRSSSLFLRWLKRILFYGAIFSFAFLTFVFLWLWHDFPDIKGIKPGVKRQSIVYLNRHHVEIGRHGDLYGEPLQSNTIPENLKKSLFAIEDSRFMEHAGVDVIGILRAFYRNIRAGHVVQGGSTITQQIAKNVFLSHERSLKRKLQEFAMALLLEKKFTKNQLLAIYFNRAYFGSGVYGVDAAAQEYFGIPATRLTLAQSTVLVSLLKAPSRLSPFNNPEKVKKRAKIVAQRLVELKYISAFDYHHLISSIDNLSFQKPSQKNNAGYFIDWVRHQIPKLIHTKQDLIVRTTLNTSLQENAATVLKKTLNQSGENLHASQGAFVALQVDGAVVSMVGGKDYHQSSFNRAWQAKRQLGSLFKLFVYCAGLENGIFITDQFSDTPPKITGWQPKNYGWRSRGMISVEDGFTYSVNAIAVRIAHKIGIKKVIEMAHRFGLTQPLDENLSTALGSGSSSLLKITAAFAAIKNKARPITPYAILEIWDTNGNLIYQRVPPKQNKPLLSTKVQADITKLLYSSNSRGTGRRAYIPNLSIGSKTGTSQNFRDAWFIGLTPTLIAGVWLGNDDESPMKSVTGGRLPGEIWKKIFLKGLPADQRTSPSVASDKKKKISDSK